MHGGTPPSPFVSISAGKAERPLSPLRPSARLWAAAAAAGADPGERISRHEFTLPYATPDLDRESLLDRKFNVLRKSRA